MADYPPFMNAYGNISKILSKIKDAKTPDRFTQDFLGTGLGFTGGSSKAFIPFLKRIGLLSSDGVPTELYHRFRNPHESGKAMADAIRRGYPTVFARNEYAHKMDKSKLTGLITELTGLDAKNGTLRSIVESFLALKEMADFEGGDGHSKASKNAELSSVEDVVKHTPALTNGDAGTNGLRFSYTIYLNLPNTDNIAVFNAIFKSLKENLPQS
jgi:Family of unknown function (DUF5343)